MPRDRRRDATWTSLHAKPTALSGIWQQDSERLRQFVEAVVHVLCTGVAWEGLPERFGRPDPLCRRYRRRAVAGIWDAPFTAGVPEDARGHMTARLQQTEWIAGGIAYRRAHGRRRDPPSSMRGGGES